MPRHRQTRHAPLEQRELAAIPAQSAAAPGQLWSVEWLGLLTSGKERRREASPTMVTMATAVACPMHAHTALLGKGSLSFRVRSRNRGLQGPLLPGSAIWRLRETLALEPVDPLNWRVSISPREEPMARAYLRFSAWSWGTWACAQKASSPH